MKHDFFQLEKDLGVEFQNKEYLRQALVHRSYLNEHPDFELDHNERLEFLGDAVLELVVTEYLYKNYSNPEGELTNWRASLVNSQILAQTAGGFDISEFLYLSKGEAKDSDGKARQGILANTFEALIGAMYLDQGYDIAKGFISRTLISELPRILEEKSYKDPKSRFQEISQEKLSITPSYAVLEENGPDHSKFFKVGVFLNEELVATGTGSSKHEAQISAAQKALQVKGW